MKFLFILFLAQLSIAQASSMNPPTARNTNGDAYIVPKLKKIGIASTIHFKSYLLRKFSLEGSWPVTHNIPDDFCYVDKNLSLICHINTYKMTRQHDKVPIDYIFYPRRGHYNSGNLWNVSAPQKGVFLSLNLVEFEEYINPSTKEKTCTYRFSTLPYYPTYLRGFYFVSFKVVKLPSQQEAHSHFPSEFVPWFKDLNADSVEYRVGCTHPTKPTTTDFLVQ